MMRYLLLAAVGLACVCPPAWARDLNADEKALAGAWIETSGYSDRLELFEDGTGKGVLGDFFEWKLLGDNRLKADAPVFGGLKIATSEPVDLREGFFYLDGREFIRYEPGLEATYIELSRAARAAGDTDKAMERVPNWLRNLNSPDSHSGSYYVDQFRKDVAAVEAASRECLTRAGNALSRSPGFARANLVETECRKNDLKYVELQGDARSRYPKGLSELSSAVGGESLMGWQRGANAPTPPIKGPLGEIWQNLRSFGPLLAQLPLVEKNISFWTNNLTEKRQELAGFEGTGSSEPGHGKNTAKQRNAHIAYLKDSITSSQSELDEYEQKAKKIRADLDQKGAALAATLAKQKKDQLDAIIAAYGRALSAGLPPPRKAETLNALAVIYATTDVPEVSDGTKAVDAAKQALALFPRSPTYTSTLAAAYARAGDFTEAVRVQQQAIDLLSPAASQDAERTAQQGRLDLYRQGKAIGGPSRSP